MNTLVIGYGSDIRRDDGAGRRVAEEIATWGLSSVNVLSVHQLTPELAEVIASSSRVYFVDVRPADGQSLMVHRVTDTSSPRGNHISNPTEIVVLARELFGSVPPAWLVTIPAIDFSFGSQLSPTTVRGVQQALQFFYSVLSEQSDRKPPSPMSSHDLL